MNLAKGDEMKLGERSEGLSQKFAEYMAAIYMFAARELKIHPEIVEVEQLLALMTRMESF